MSPHASTPASISFESASNGAIARLCDGHVHILHIDRGAQKTRLTNLSPWGRSDIEALRVNTINGAYAPREEAIKGSITAGKLADFVVLADDPHTVDPEKIKDIAIVRTVTGGANGAPGVRGAPPRTTACRLRACGPSRRRPAVGSSGWSRAKRRGWSRSPGQAGRPSRSSACAPQPQSDGGAK
jgi:amidohydrolase family protein